MNYTEQANQLFDYFLENTFYKSWRTLDHTGKDYLQNYKSLELMVTPDCPLNCKYCYFSRFGDGLFPEGSRNRAKALHNAGLIIDWLYANEFYPNIEIFSGDSFVDVTSRKMVHKILDSALEGKSVARSIVVPTNMVWLLNKKQRDDVYTILEKADAASTPLFVSASVDGKYMEDNRPFKSKKKKYTDEFYHDLFTFISARNCGLHPMVYAEGIENWPKNFEWFQQKMKEYGIPWNNIYLLEVRNDNWTVERTKHLGKFMRYLVRFLWDLSNHDGKTFQTHITQPSKGFNILANWYSTVGRGLGCSLQSTVCVRTGDLTIVPCHRTAYKGMETAKFRVADNKIVGFDAKNLELYFAAQQCNSKIQPYCEACNLAPLCLGGCLGSQYESTGDLFTPIPTVCRMEYMKVYSIVDELDKIGQLSGLYNKLNTEKQHAVDILMEHRKKESNYEFTKN